MYCKWQFKPDKATKSLSAEDAATLDGYDRDYATSDLFHAVEKSEFPSSSAYVQIMTLDEAARYRWNIFDGTKVWPHSDYPLIPIGKTPDVAIESFISKAIFAKAPVVYFGFASMMGGIVNAEKSGEGNSKHH